MKVKKKHGIVAAVAILLVLSVVIGNLLNMPSVYDDKNYKIKLKNVTAPQKTDISFDTSSEGYVCVAESNAVSLWFDFARGIFYIENPISGFRWGSDVTQDMIPDNDFEKKPLDFIFSATLSNKSNGNTLVVNTSKDAGRSYFAIENGVAVRYDFAQYGIGVTVQLYIENDAFMCRIPLSEITEEGDYYLLNIDLLPFFGASAEGEEGYILYPDGCGALYNLGDTDSGVGKVITTAVYSDHVLDIDSLLEKKSKNINTVHLPFFGTKRGNEAMAALVVEGDISSNINLSPFGCVYKLNRIYSTSVYRCVQSSESTDATTTYFDTEKDMRGNDYCVMYKILTGEEADYSGMARAIRTYMVNNGRIPDEAEINYDMYIELLMGVKSKSLLGYKYEATTTAEQAEDMLSDILTDDLKASVTLLGWQKEGYGVLPSGSVPAHAIGGSSGLKKLGSSAADINLSYGTAIANTTSTGSKIRRDAVSSLRGITLMDSAEDNFVINPVKAGEFYGKALKNILTLGCDGVALSGCSDMVYDDYNKKGGVTRAQTASVFLDMMKKTVDAGQGLVLENANAYTWEFASMLAKMPESDSGYSVLKYDVPFIYLVLNGSVSYSLSTPGNCSADFTMTKLKWIECGAAPYFLLTNDSSDEMVGTAAGTMFSTQYSDKREQVKETLAEFSDISARLGGAVMSGHKIISENVRVSEYSNGMRIYVNYSDEAQNIGGVLLEPLSYAIV